MPERSPESTPSAEQITQHIHLVHQIVSQFARSLPKSVQREDLIASGTLGLFYALRSTTHTCPEMLESYARIRIRGAIRDELRRHDWAPRQRKEPKPTGQPVGQDGNVVALRPDCSSTLPPRVQVVGFEDLPPSVEHAADSASPLEELEAHRDRELVLRALDELPPRERAVIRMRYFEDIPSKAIASALGLSESRISQLHARATARLRIVLAGMQREVKLAA